jgi:hypothetical protein
MDRGMFERLPNFMILGVAKTGTTSLHSYLRQHPSIFLSDPKEPHFFDQREADYLNKLQVYLRECFTGAESFPLRGEATPTYFTQPRLVAPRLREFYGDRPLKFIVGLRDPVSRAWSHYIHRVGIGEESESLPRALELEAQRLDNPKAGWVGYYRDGLYAQHFKVWLEYFDRERFEFFLSDDLRQNGDATVRQILEFLGADSTVKIDTIEKLLQAGQIRNRLVRIVTNNRQRSVRLVGKLFFGGHYGMGKFRKWLRDKFRETYSVPPQMDTDIEKELRCRYADDIMELSKLLDRDLSSWLPATSVSVRQPPSSVS